jgi:hypothetical protein
VPGPGVGSVACRGDSVKGMEEVGGCELFRYFLLVFERFKIK